MNLLVPTVPVAVRGPASREVAWGRYADVGKWTSWSPQLRRVEADGPRLREGLTGTVHGPAGVSARFEVLDVDEAEMTWSWRVWRGPLSVRLEHGVEPDGGGSRAWVAVTAPAPIAVGYLPLAAVALHNLVSG